MTEAIVCAVIAAIAAVTVGIINAFSQKKTKQELSAEFQKELQEAREKEKARQRYEVYMIKGIMASNTLSEATARAVQRIPDAHCNGDRHGSRARRGRKGQERDPTFSRQARRQQFNHLALARSRVSAFNIDRRNYL